MEVGRLIDEEKTFIEKGYYSNELSHGSHKPVYAVCEGVNCQREGGRGRWVRFQDYRDLCYECAMIVCHIHKYKEKTKKLKCIDDDKTLSEKGYRSTWLKPNSSRDVWRICDICKDGRWIKFSDYSELCQKCVCTTDEYRKKIGDSNRDPSEKTRRLMSENHADVSGENHPNWQGGISFGDYCPLFNEPLKGAIRNYFCNMCFECGETIEENKGREMSVHHVNYQKNCGCDNTNFCIYVPLCMKCHGKTSGNRCKWYLHFMVKLALCNPNYYAYHIPVVFYDEPSYNYDYVFNMRR